MKRVPKASSEGEALLASQLQCEKIEFQVEFRAVGARKFRWDFYVPPDVLIEVQGGVWRLGSGAHSNGKGITRDAEKASLAAVYGYRTITATTAQVKRGEAIDWIKRAIGR